MMKATSPSSAIVTLAAGGLLCLGLSLPAAAQAPQADAQRDDRAAAARTDRADPNEIICVRTPVSGSRVLRELCQTRRDWELDGGVPTADDR